MQTLKGELLYAIVKFLEDESCNDAAQLVRKFIDDKNILPQRINTCGRVFNHDFKSFDNIYCQKDPRLLFKYYEILVDYLKKSEWNVEQSNSLFGITSRIDRCQLKRNFSTESLSGIIRPKCSHSFEDICNRLHCQLDLVRHNLAHRNAIYCLQFDHRGEYAFTGSDDYTIKIWSLQTKSDTRPCTIRHVLRGHVAEIIELALSPDNHLLASVDSSSCLIIWCLRTGQPILSMRGSPLNRVLSGLAFVPVHAPHTQKDKAFSADAGPCEGEDHCPRESTLSDSAPMATPNGLLAVTSFGGFLHMIPFQHEVRSAALPVDSVPNTDRWSCCSLTVLPTVRFTTAPADTPTAFWPSIACMDVSPGGALIATGCSDQRVRLYYLRSNPIRPELAAVLDAHEECVNSVAFSHSGLKLATGSSDGGSCWLWRLQGGSWRSMALTCRKRIKCRPCLLVWSKHDRYLIASMKNGSVYVYFGDSGRLATVIEGHEGAIHAVTPSPFDDNIVATAGVDGRFQIWNIERHRNHAAQSNSSTNLEQPSCSESNGQTSASPLLYHYRYPPGRFESEQGFVWLPSDPAIHDQPIWSGARRSMVVRDALPSNGTLQRDRSSLSQDPAAIETRTYQQGPSSAGAQWNQRITACRALPTADGVGFLLVTKSGLMSLFRAGIHRQHCDEQYDDMGPEYFSLFSRPADKTNVIEQFFHWELDTAVWRQIPVDEADPVAVQRFHETASILGVHLTPQAAGAYCRVRGGGQRTSRLGGANGRHAVRNDIAEDSSTAAGSGTAADLSLPTPPGSGYRPPQTVLFEIVHDPSGVPFHRLPPPYLTNFVGVPLPAESQIHVPGRSSLVNPLDLIPSLTIDEDGVDIVIDDIQFRADVPSDYCPPVRTSTMRPIAGKTYLWQSVWLDGSVPLIEPLSTAELAVHLERSRKLYEEEVQFYLSQGEARVNLTDESTALEKPHLSVQPTRNAFGPVDANNSSAEPGSLSSRDVEKTSSTAVTPLPTVNSVDSGIEAPGPSFLHKFLAKRFESQNATNNRNVTNDNFSSNSNNCHGCDYNQTNNHNSDNTLISTVDANRIVPADNIERSQVVNELDDAEDEDPDDDASEESEWSEHIDVDIGWWNRQRRRNRPRRAAAAQATQEPLRTSEELSDVGDQQSRRQPMRRGTGSRIRRVRHSSASHVHHHRRNRRQRSGAVLHPCRRSIRQRRRLMLRRRILREMRLTELRAERENQQHLRRSQRRNDLARPASRSSIAPDGAISGSCLETVTDSKSSAPTEEKDTISARRERLKRRLIRSMDYALFTASAVPLSSVPPEGYVGPDCEGCVYPVLNTTTATHSTDDPVHWPGPHFDWLSSVHPSATPYVPQLGDRLVYIVRGHREYLAHAWQNCELPALTRPAEHVDGVSGEAVLHDTSSLPWVAWPEIPAYTCGVLTEIRYNTVRTITDDSTVRIPTGTYRGSRASAVWRRRGSRSGVKHARASSKRLPTSVPDSGHSQSTSSPNVPAVAYSGDSFVRLVTLRIRLDPRDQQPYAHLARSTASSDGCGKTAVTEINVTYHDVDGVLDFLVLRHLFDAAVRRTWKSGDLFICPVGEVWWTGCVLHAPSNFLTNPQLSCEPSTSTTPPPRDAVKDPWLACLIRWLEDDQLRSATDDGTFTVDLPWSSMPLDSAGTDETLGSNESLPENVDRLSPWDMHLPCAKPLPEDVRRVYPVQAQIRRNYGAGICETTGSVSQSSANWTAHAQSVLECFREIMKLPISELFNQPVDLVSYPDYLFVNPYPVDLTLIVARLTTGFYRQAAAVRSDLQHLLDNAVRYNRPDSTVVQHAHLVYRLGLLGLDNPRFDACRIPQEYERLLAAESEQLQPMTTSLNRHSRSASPRSESERRCTSTTGTTGATDRDLLNTETHVYSTPARRVRHTPRKLAHSADSRTTTNSETKVTRPGGENGIGQQVEGNADRSDPCHCSLAPDQWVPRCTALVKRLCMHERSLFFREPINTNLYPDYLDIVSVPMDLSTVQKRLRSTLESVHPRFHELRARPGLRRRRNFVYACPHAFLRDMHRIVRNSKQYNDDPETVVHDDTCWLENWIEQVLIATLRRFRLLPPSNPGETEGTSGSPDQSQSAWSDSRLSAARGAMGYPARIPLRTTRLVTTSRSSVHRLCNRPSRRSVVRRGGPRKKHISAPMDSHQSSRFSSGPNSPRRTSSGRVVRPPVRNYGTISYTSSISSDSDGGGEAQDRAVKRSRGSGLPGRARSTRVTTDALSRRDVAVRRSKRPRRRSNARRSPFIFTGQAAVDGESCDE